MSIVIIYTMPWNISLRFEVDIGYIILHTVKPVYNNHHSDKAKAVTVERWSLYT